jgi:hypothetical protein
MARTKKKNAVPVCEETEDVREIRERCKDLRAAGWKTLSVTYQGSGDSCDGFCFSLGNEEETFNFSAVPATLLPAHFNMSKLEQRLWSLLPEGFENNEGGDGEICIDVETGEIHVKHNHYYVESNFAEWKY